MSRDINVPVRMFKGKAWAWLSGVATAHHIVAEQNPKLVDQNFSFIDGHRVRLWKFKKNVHWKPAGQELEISKVKPATTPRRKTKR